MISYDEFKKVEIKIGQIISAERVPESDKLFRLTVDFKEETPRQIVSGIVPYFPDERVLIGKKCAFATNLEPRVIRGLESNGMILAVSGEDGEKSFFSLLETNQDVLPGSAVK
jgi:methionyl-tRNA synthetase